MKFRYSKYKQVTLSKDSYIFWNKYTECKMICDKSISYTEDGWHFSKCCSLSNRDFEFLKKNGLIIEVTGSLGNIVYWDFTEEALGMDITIYRPHIKRN